MRRVILCVPMVMVLLSLGSLSCGQRVTSSLNMQNPDQAGASEIVIIKITDDGGKPVSGARIYSPECLGDTAEDGSLVTFFKEPGDKLPVLDNSAPWKIQSREGEIVFEPVALQAIVRLAPGEDREWTP